MRVAIVTSSYWPIVGGQMIYVRDLARELVRQGHDVTVATRFVSSLRKTTWSSLTEAEPAKRYEEDGVKVRVVRPNALGRLALYPVHRLHYYAQTEGLAIWLFEVAFTDAIDRAIGPCDVVHFSGVGREMFGFAAEKVARRRCVPFVVTTHMHPGTWGDSRLDFKLYKRADRILALTSWEKTVYVERGIRPDKVEVTGEAVITDGTGNADRARTRYNLRGSPVVLFVGRKAHYKGYGLLLDSMPLIWDAFPETQLVIVGPDQDEPSAAQRAVLADPRVHATGPISDAERDDLYAACDVLCVPSEAESFGLVYFEAWRHGKPVVALDIPPLRELITASGGGVLVPTRTAQAVADAVAALLKDRHLRETMGASGRDFSLEYTPERVIARILGVYSEARAGAAPLGELAARGV